MIIALLMLIIGSACSSQRPCLFWSFVFLFWSLCLHALIIISVCFHHWLHLFSSTLLVLIVHSAGTYHSLGLFLSLALLFLIIGPAFSDHRLCLIWSSHLLTLIIGFPCSDHCLCLFGSSACSNRQVCLFWSCVIENTTVQFCVWHYPRMAESWWVALRIRVYWCTIYRRGRLAIDWGSIPAQSQRSPSIAQGPYWSQVISLWNRLLF